jgi:hypothetical protein
MLYRKIKITLNLLFFIEKIKYVNSICYNGVFSKTPLNE